MITYWDPVAAIKLAVYLDRYLGSIDVGFVESVQSQIDKFVRENTKNCVLLFPPVNSYQRLLIHRTAEQYPDLKSFSVGEGEDRRTVICYITDFNSDPESAELMSSGRPSSSRGRGRGKFKDYSPSPSYRQSDQHVPTSHHEEKISKSQNSTSSETEKIVKGPGKQQRVRNKRPEIQVYVPRGRRLINEQEQQEEDCEGELWEVEDHPTRTNKAPDEYINGDGGQQVARNIKTGHEVSQIESGVSSKQQVPPLHNDVSVGSSQVDCKGVKKPKVRNQVYVPPCRRHLAEKRATSEKSESEILEFDDSATGGHNKQTETTGACNKQTAEPSGNRNKQTAETTRDHYKQTAETTRGHNKQTAETRGDHSKQTAETTGDHSKQTAHTTGDHSKQTADTTGDRSKQTAKTIGDHDKQITETKTIEDHSKQTAELDLSYKSDTQAHKRNTKYNRSPDVRNVVKRQKKKESVEDKRNLSNKQNTLSYQNTHNTVVGNLNFVNVSEDNNISDINQGFWLNSGLPYPESSLPYSEFNNKSSSVLLEPEIDDSTAEYLRNEYLQALGNDFPVPKNQKHSNFCYFENVKPTNVCDEEIDDNGMIQEIDLDDIEIHSQEEVSVDKHSEIFSDTGLSSGNKQTVCDSVSVGSSEDESFDLCPEQLTTETCDNPISLTTSANDKICDNSNSCSVSGLDKICDNSKSCTVSGLDKICNNSDSLPISHMEKTFDNNPDSCIFSDMEFTLCEKEEGKCGIIVSVKSGNKTVVTNSNMYSHLMNGKNDESDCTEECLKNHHMEIDSGESHDTETLVKTSLTSPKHDNQCNINYPDLVEKQSKNTKQSDKIDKIDTKKYNVNSNNAASKSDNNMKQDTVKKTTEESDEKVRPGTVSKTQDRGLSNKNSPLENKDKPATDKHISASESSDEDEDEDSWDKMFDEDGECLDPSALDELTNKVGKVKIKKATIDYYSYQPKDPQLDYDEMGHIIEIYDFPADFVTRDLLSAFQQYSGKGFDIKWVDDTHALGVFASVIAAQDALSMAHPLLKVRSLSESSRQCKVKARKCTEFLQPYKARPETSAVTARRLVTGALGLAPKVSREQRDQERKMLKQAREKRKQDRRQREDIWEGTYKADEEVDT